MDAAFSADLIRDSLSQGQQPALTITSNSMKPLLYTGDQVTLESISATQLAPGDIITVETEADLLTHRFWGLVAIDGEDFLLTRGDRPLTFDPPCPKTNLVGRVSACKYDQVHLWLNKGYGRWLNHQLAQLAEKEWHWLIGRKNSSPASWYTKDVAVAPAGNLTRWFKLLRRVVFYWGVCMTMSVKQLTKFSRREQIFTHRANL